MKAGVNNHMSKEDRSTAQSNPAAEGKLPKKPYQKPSFRHERIFETMALSCGKHDSTQQQCHLNTKSS
jgi:hypothetical protein